MASQLYPQGAAHILGKSTKVDFVADTIKLLFYSASYVSTHEFVSDLTGASIIARSAAFTSKTVTNGTFDAADVTITAVSGAAFTHIIVYKDSGSDATSPLVGLWDISSFTPNGGDITVVFNAAGLFSIA